MNLGTYVESKNLGWLETIVNDAFNSASIETPSFCRKKEGMMYTLELDTPFRIPGPVVQEIKTRIFNEGWAHGAMEKKFDDVLVPMRKPPHFKIFSYEKHDIETLKNIIEDSYKYNKEQLPNIVECQRGKQFYLHLETRYVPKPVFDQVMKRWNLRHRGNR